MHLRALAPPLQHFRQAPARAICNLWAYGDVLESLAKKRDETECLRHIAHHEILLEFIVHCRSWFFQRHVNFAARGKHATVREEAAVFFLLDAAADAARSYFARHPEDVTAAALKGIWILAADLSNAADPMGLRACISQRVTAWLSLVKQHGETQRAKSARGGRRRSLARPSGSAWSRARRARTCPTRLGLTSESTRRRR